MIGWGYITNYNAAVTGEVIYVRIMNKAKQEIYTT